VQVSIEFKYFYLILKLFCIFSDIHLVIFGENVLIVSHFIHGLLIRILYKIAFILDYIGVAIQYVSSENISIRKVFI